MSVSQFWERFGDMGFENLPTLASLRTFKRGVTPSWEHPANHNGGKWIVVVPKLMSVGVFNEVLAAIISGKLQAVNGVLLSKKRREDLVNVWTAAAPEAQLELVKSAIVERLAKNLGIEADISFKRHGSKKAQKTAKGLGYEDIVLDPYSDGEEEGPTVAAPTPPNKKKSKPKPPKKAPLQNISDGLSQNKHILVAAFSVLVMGLVLAGMMLRQVGSEL